MYKRQAVISAEGLAAARAFADGMGDIMDVVGAAVDVLGAAAGTTDWQNLSIDQIFIALRQVIVRSVQILRDASGFVAAEGLAAARAFADGMGDIMDVVGAAVDVFCLLYTSPSPRDRTRSRMPSSA
mgnify:CR=1 FL=1